MNPLEILNLKLANPVLTDSKIKTGDIPQTRKEKFAKDFESIFLEKLLNEMKDSIGNWGFEEDGAAKQIQGLFWMNLARDMADKGGVGLWKEIYQSLDATEKKIGNPETIDSQL